MTASDPASGAGDSAWLRERMGSVSEVFALAVAPLEAPLGDEVRASYLLARAADTVEDAAHVPTGERARLLGLLDRALAAGDPTTGEAFRDATTGWAPSDPDASWTVVASTPRVLAAVDRFAPASRAAVRSRLRGTVAGMARTLVVHGHRGGVRLPDAAALDRYCWDVSGQVAALVADLAGGPGANAAAFGRYVELANVARDVREDALEDGARYLPGTWLADAGAPRDPEALLAAEHRDAVAGVLSRVADRAAAARAGALAFLEALPDDRGNALSAWTLPFLLAAATLRAVREAPGAVLEAGGLLADGEIGRVAALANHAGDRDLRRLADAAASGDDRTCR